MSIVLWLVISVDRFFGYVVLRVRRLEIWMLGVFKKWIRLLRLRRNKRIYI